MIELKVFNEMPQYDDGNGLPLTSGATAVILGVSAALCLLIFLAGVAVGVWLL